MIPAPKSPSSHLVALARRVSLKAVHLTLISGLLAAALMVGIMETPKVSVDRVDAVGSADATAAGHRCWTEAEGQPADVDKARHVVVTLDGDDHATYGGPRMTRKALDQEIFAGKHVGTVHAFCA